LRFTRKHFSSRQTRLRRRIVAEGIDCFLTTAGSRLRYLVGFTGSNGLLVLGQRTVDFLTDGRYTEQAQDQVRGARITIARAGLTKALPRLKELSEGHPRIGYEPQWITDDAVRQLKLALPHAFLLPLEGFVDPLTQVKDPQEIACIRKAAAIADDAFAQVLGAVKPGVQERDIAAELEYYMSKGGSEKRAFETIVASGPRAALPHGVASTRRIKKGDFVTFDFGATVEGYVSDITRTVVVGRATARQRRIYDLVLRAQQRAVARVRSGVTGIDLDRVARRMIERAGHGKRFDHGLGHGIGLSVHEGPSLGPRSRDTLKSSMVITVEPGVYFPGWGGVRIEDDVIVRPSGCTVLTKSERSLLEL